MLNSNTELLNIITDFETKLRGREVFGMAYIRSQAARSVFHTLRMVKSLDDLSGHKYGMLFDAVERINFAIKAELDKRVEIPIDTFVLPYSEITKDMVDWVGGKNANLGELKNMVGLPAPEGFAVTTRAYQYFIEENRLIDEIQRLRMNIDPEDPNAVVEVSEDIRTLITNAPIPPILEDEILSAYNAMCERLGGRRPAIALRSSAIGEDSELSFAGQYLSVLNVPEDEISETYKNVIASLYTTRAVSYRLNKGMRDEDIAMSVACIEMIDSVVSGITYSRRPFHLFDENILINAVWGLGPYVVDGVVTPDEYIVEKTEPLKVLSVDVAGKDVQLSMNPEGGLIETPVPPERRNVACLTQDQILQLAEYAVKLERHNEYPQDIEWALDSHGRLLILQARPLHIETSVHNAEETVSLAEGYRVLMEGGAIAFPGVGCGPVFVAHSQDDLANFPESGVLTAAHSYPEFVVVMKKASAIITDAGSVTGHMASLAREFGIPTLLNTKSATKVLTDGMIVTVDALSGRVYEGEVPQLLALQRPRESVMKDTPVYRTLRNVTDFIIPLNLTNPKSPNFKPENCATIHDIMRFAHEVSYKEMFQISDLVCEAGQGGALKLRAYTSLDLHIIDLGDGLKDVEDDDRWVSREQITSAPLIAVLNGMLNEEIRNRGVRPVDFGGFFSVMREQMAAGGEAERFGDRSYALISDKYLNFSSRIGYHYSVLDAYCGDTVNKNYITFSFKGGAANEVRRNRRVRCIAKIFTALGFSVETREDRLDARHYKYERAEIEQHLETIGKLLQYTRQMDMLMKSEASVDLMAHNFLAGNYALDQLTIPDAPETSSQ